jgi:hypothetical protein
MPVLNRHDDFPGSNLSTNEIDIANKVCKWVVQVKIVFMIVETMK